MVVVFALRNPAPRAAAQREFGVPRLRGPDRLKAELRTNLSSAWFIIAMRVLDWKGKLSVNLPSDAMSGERSKAAASRTHSKRYARFGGVWQSRSVWSACGLPPLFLRPVQGFNARIIDRTLTPARETSKPLPSANAHAASYRYV